MLRRLATGERVDDAVDWPNLIEEVESLGRSELHAVESLLARALEHLLRLYGWPEARDAQHWRGEIGSVLLSARRRFTPGMRQVIDLSTLYSDARDAVVAMALEGAAPRRPPGACPYDLGVLLPPRPDGPDVDALLAWLDEPVAPPRDA